jgi:CxxC-x17-CxxC domain-containing protein
MRDFDRGPRRDGGRREGGRGGGFRGGGGGGFNRGPREMHKAVCSDCGKECEVPFKPSGDRPVYCKDCFMKHKKY